MTQRVICLLRCSTETQDFPAQRSDVEKWLAKHALVVAPDDWREEPYTSGAARVRPVLERFLDEAAAGEVSHVVVADFDRLGRAGVETLWIVHQLVGMKPPVTVVCVRDKLLRNWGSAETWAFAFMRAAIGILKLDVVSKTTKASFEKRDGVTVARRSGKRPGRPGWAWTPEADAELLRLLSTIGTTCESIHGADLLRIEMVSKTRAVVKVGTPKASTLRARAAFLTREPETAAAED